MHAVVVAAAHPDQLAEFGDRPDVVIAADSGLHAVAARGWTPDRIVGDLDSADADAVDTAEVAGAIVERHRDDKDETDLELALASAVAAGARSIEVVVRGDGRLDHQLANLVSLAAPTWADFDVSARVGAHRVWVVRGERRLSMNVGQHLALVAVGGPATVTSRGVAFPLDAEVLSPFQGRGIANEATAAEVDLRIDDGVVLVVSSPTRTNDLDDAPG